MSALRAIGLAVLVLAPSAPAPAFAEQCQVVEVALSPAEIADADPMRSPSQIVIWLERADGTYVDTIFITAQTGSYGLGNRPGRFDFNSGPKWPYGRRTTVFPVWAHRHGMEWPLVVFQNFDEDNLSHPFAESTSETRFCRPLTRTEAGWDAATCATLVYTDKGKLDAALRSKYPPRNDETRFCNSNNCDDPSVDMFAMLNPFDAVSQPTPPSGQPALISWPLPESGIPSGDYVVWVEVSREFDHNATYSTDAYPEPTLENQTKCHITRMPCSGTCPDAPGGTPQNCVQLPLQWQEYGEAYRGQPSIVYKVPISIGAGEHVGNVLDYLGYSDPDGLDGNLRAPDNTISTGVTGSGAERLAVQLDNGVPYRVRVVARTEIDDGIPGAPQEPNVAKLTTSSAEVEFTAPGDDGLVGRVKGYEIRYHAGGELTEDNFAAATELKPELAIGDPGTLHAFPITGLLYDTEYTVGIRALDDCRHVGPIASLTFRTPQRAIGEVDACFLATAAYGSAMANDVAALRGFRDRVLQQTVLGELAVEAYYTFGPALAGVVGESELLRATARGVLSPVIATVRALRPRQ